MIVAQGFLHSDYSSQIELRLVEERGRTSLLMAEKENRDTKKALRLVAGKLGEVSRQASLLPLRFFGREGNAGSSFHCGSTFPMRENPCVLESDMLGRPAGLRRVFVVDASVLPSIPATTITLSVMANAYRIATESVDLRI